MVRIQGGARICYTIEELVDQSVRRAKGGNQRPPACEQIAPDSHKVVLDALLIQLAKVRSSKVDEAVSKLEYKSSVGVLREREVGQTFPFELLPTTGSLSSPSSSR